MKFIVLKNSGFISDRNFLNAYFKLLKIQRIVTSNFQYYYKTTVHK